MYSTFFNWAFSGNIKDPIPQGESIPEILKYNSPINATFLMKTFVTNAKMNHYLNKYINNIGIRYIDKKELFFFIKQCIIDFKVKRKDIHYINWERQNLLYSKVSKKFPLLKKDETLLLCNIIDKLETKDSIYRSLGIDKKEAKKVKKKKRTSNKISARNFIAKYFNTI